MTMERTEDNIRKWADARGLIENTTAEKQFIKLVEECGELGKAILNSNLDDTVDGIGDMLVVLTNICTKIGVDLGYCYRVAYGEIKNRKGSMINGTFVKE